MPIYEYRCERGHKFEIVQRMTDEAISTCQTCSSPVQRVFHPVAVHFKGKGFYNTDYGTRKRQRENSAAAKNGAEKSDASAAETKPAKDSKPAGDAKPSSAAKSAAKDSGAKHS